MKEQISEIIISIIFLIIRHFEKKSLIKKKDAEKKELAEELRFKFAQEKESILNSTKRF
jgi:hypothetical protein